jgi:hypothetical protein
MPVIKTAKDALEFKRSFTSKKLTRIPQYRQITDGKMTSLEALREIMAADFQKAYVPYQTGIVAQVLYDMTNIMASNQSEIRFRARATDPQIIADVQAHEQGHEALDPILFPISAGHMLVHSNSHHRRPSVAHPASSKASRREARVCEDDGRTTQRRSSAMTRRAYNARTNRTR